MKDSILLLLPEAGFRPSYRFFDVALAGLSSRSFAGLPSSSIVMNGTNSRHQFVAAGLELIIDLKTAEALGLAFPTTWLFRADEVIE